MDINVNALKILERLGRAGHAAYLVGGCVRDSLMGRTPGDWDICTAALPGQVQALFAGERVIPTGEKHGTVTVLLGDEAFEVTTFRTEGAYSDNRHPEKVDFVADIKADLARRDFTVNAMAYNPQTGLEDPFGGRQDLAARRLRAVGQPEERFNEDGLRIMRALRFAARLGFELEPKLAGAVRCCRGLLAGISAPRLNAELGGLLCGLNAEQVLLDYPEVLAVFMPEIEPMVGFLQHNAYHSLDVWGHTAKSVGAAPPSLELRLTMLLHDIGKPASFSLDEKGVGHFYGHEEQSARLARAILERLCYDKLTTGRVLRLITWHDTPVPPRSLPRWLNRLGERGLRQLLAVKRADVLAQAQASQPANLAELDALEAALESLLAAGPCYTLKDLAVNGNDLLALGFAPGRQVGAVLQALLEAVMEDSLPNQRDALLKQAAGYLGA